jgi:transcription-repair coupling factor (superfamily II helicase)
MDPKKLSDVIKNFSDKEIDVLISTTIIESGLDMPDANTVIIMNPQQMGLAQLYQLRGRVGRSETQAFAYLVVPKDANLNIETEKRLDAMTRYQYLGAGKEIALRDMEIRGVGNILGKEQSGNVNAIGLNLFMKFLKNAVNEKRNFKEIREIELPVVEIDENIGIPENFIPDIETRLQIYNEISQVNEMNKLEYFKENYEDRFGELPLPFINLFSYQEIKILALKIGVQNINLNERNCLIKFNYEIFGLTNIIKPLIKLDSKFTNNNIRIYGDLNIQELNIILTKILDLKSNLISN